MTWGALRGFILSLPNEWFTVSEIHEMYNDAFDIITDKACTQEAVVLAYRRGYFERKKSDLHQKPFIYRRIK